MDLRNAYMYSFLTSLYCIAEPHKRVSMTTFGSRLSTCIRVLQKERLLTYGVDSPGQSRGISPLQGGGGVRTTDGATVFVVEIRRNKEKGLQIGCSKGGGRTTQGATAFVCTIG